MFAIEERRTFCLDIRRGGLLEGGRKQKKKSITRNPTDILLIRDSFRLEGTERTGQSPRNWISSFFNVIQQD